MGYAAEIVWELRELGLKPGSVVGDCGSQDFAASQTPWINQALKDIYGAAPYPEGIITPARDVFERIGLDYTCFDVDYRKGTIYVDFHRLKFSPTLYNHFDATFNAGTSEHLLAPHGLFFFMHQTTKVGGLMWHSVPVFGWGNHGLNNMTPKFWHQLRTYNDYEIVKAKIVPTDTTGVDPGNWYGEHLSFFEGLKEFPTTSATVHIVFRKRHPYCFIPPFDVVDAHQARRTEKLMRDALEPFVNAGSLTAFDVDEAMAWRFGFPIPTRSPDGLPAHAAAVQATLSLAKRAKRKILRLVKPALSRQQRSD